MPNDLAPQFIWDDQMTPKRHAAPDWIWDDRLRRYNFCVCPQPFLGIPTPPQWQALVAQIRGLHQTHGLDLAVIDPLAPFVVSENNAQSMLATLLPLRTHLRPHGPLAHAPSGQSRDPRRPGRTRLHGPA